MGEEAEKDNLFSGGGNSMTLRDFAHLAKRDSTSQERNPLPKIGDKGEKRNRQVEK